MTIPADSRFWNARSSYDKEKTFADATLLWEAACGYFEWCDNNPIIEKHRAGKDAKEVEKELTRAYTIEGLCSYLNCSKNYFDMFKRDCKEEPLLFVAVRIEETIYRQKFEAAAAGLLNATIISKDLGLKEKDTTDDNNIIPVIIDWSDCNKADCKTEGSSADSSNT